jgi:hypothetical protein
MNALETAEKHKTNCREWYRNNAERKKEISRKYRKSNRDKIKEASKIYRSKNKDKIKEANKEANKKYYLSHKDVINKRVKIRRHARVDWFNEYKTKLKCHVCGESRPLCLDFHHVNRAEKDTCIGNMLLNSRSKILKEMSKCIVLCSNCHRVEHGNGK